MPAEDCIEVDDVSFSRSWDFVAAFSQNLYTTVGLLKMSISSFQPDFVLIVWDTRSFFLEKPEEVFLPENGTKVSEVRSLAWSGERAKLDA